MWNSLLSIFVELSASESAASNVVTSLDIPHATLYQISLDVLLFVFALYILMRKPQKEEKPLSEKEINQLIDEFEPEPLFPKLDERRAALGKKVPTITGANGTHVVIDGKTALSFTRTNFLGMITNPQVDEAANKALYKYGTGSCGPRGFYGTIDVHLDLEKRIKEFMDSEDCLIYAYGFATVSSSIPAFASRGDLLIVDKGVNYAVQTGVKISRAEVMWFEHNDVNDLERILQKVQQIDQKTGRKITRRYIVIEGLYHNYGDFAPLPKIVELKDKYKYRLIMDDSYAIGAVGNTGRGTCEVFNVPVKKIDILTGCLETTVSSVGGFCCGSSGIVFHQRLHASGYVYSASLPPLLATAAHAAFDYINGHSELPKTLLEKTKTFIEGLNGVKGMHVRSAINSPVIHLELVNRPKQRMDEEETLQAICDKALENGVHVSRAYYIPEQEQYPPAPSIRFYVSTAHSDEQIKTAVEVIKKAAASVL